MITIEQLIKIILGIIVLVAVILGVYMFFRNYVIDFFKNVGGKEAPALIFSLLK